MEHLATVPVGSNPHETAITPDGRFAYVTNYSNSFGNEISIIELTSFREIRRITIGDLQGPHGIVFAAGRIWFTAERTGNVGRFDPLIGALDWVGTTLGNGGHMLAVTADGRTAYTVNIGTDNVSVIPVSGTATVASTLIPVVNEPEGIALSPDGRELWAGSRGPFGISIIDLTAQRVAATISPGLPAYRLAFSPDGRFVVAPRQNRVVVYDASTRQIVREINTGGQALSLAFAPDSVRLFVATTFPDRIVRVNIISGQVTGTVASGPTSDGIAYGVQYEQVAGRHRAVRR